MDLFRGSPLVSDDRMVIWLIPKKIESRMKEPGGLSTRLSDCTGYYLIRQILFDKVKTWFLTTNT